MMYQIPLTVLPNQTFSSTIPIDLEIRTYEFYLWYNYIAEYWLISAKNPQNGQMIFRNLPLLVSKGKFGDMLHQLRHKKIGTCSILPVVMGKEAPPNDSNLDTDYVMVWGDD